MDADEGMYCAANGSISLVVIIDCVNEACLAASEGVRGSSQLECVVVGRDELLVVVIVGGGRARGDGGSIRPVCSGSTGDGGELGGLLCGFAPRYENRLHRLDAPGAAAPENDRDMELEREGD